MSRLTFCESRPFGGTFVLDPLWHRLGIDTVLRGLDTSPGAPLNIEQYIQVIPRQLGRRFRRED